MAATMFEWIRVWTLCSVATALLYGQCVAASRRHYAHRGVGAHAHPSFSPLG